MTLLEPKRNFGDVASTQSSDSEYGVHPTLWRRDLNIQKFSEKREKHSVTELC